MTDTTTRPSPERLLWIATTNMLTGDETMRVLAQHGYVIVHPDDVPEFGPDAPGTIYDGAEEFIASLDQSTGWNACRAHIFGDA